MPSLCILLGIAIAHDLLVLHRPPPFLLHLAVRAPAQEQESGDDQETAADGSEGERLAAGKGPVDYRDEEDGEAEV